MICARLFYVIFYPGDKYLKNPAEIFRIHDGGLAIYGGLIGAVVFGSLMAKVRKLKVGRCVGHRLPGLFDWPGCGPLGEFYQPRGLWQRHRLALGNAQR